MTPTITTIQTIEERAVNINERLLKVMGESHPMYVATRERLERLRIKESLKS